MPVFFYTPKGTIVPSDDFDPESDAEKLRGAMKGFGTDEEEIIEVLAWRTQAQRVEIKDHYESSYGRDLVDDLKGELGGDMEDAILALMKPLDKYLASELHEALDGFGTNERCLIEVLCGRDNDSINAIKEAFEEEYGDSLIDKIQGDTSGAFEHLLVSMAAANRDEDTLDPDLAKEQAAELDKAGEGKMGTDESAINKIFATCSQFQLMYVFHEYEEQNGHGFDVALQEELSGDILDGFMAVYESMQNRPGFFAERLNDALSGAGTKDRALIRILVSRAEVDLSNVKEEYEKKYDRTLADHIENDTNGKYKKLLLAIVEEN